MLSETIKQNFLSILKEELIPAMGCTEPIALAFASARGASLLSRDLTKIVARCSGNIIKNVRCVRIPNSGGMTGIICDGAKASCAVKISSALDAAFFAHALAMKGKAYASRTGILQEETGDTISCVGHIGRVGMQPTDTEIVKIMIHS